MPQPDEILGGTFFDPEQGLQYVYGAVYAYGDIITSGSITVGSTGSIPNPTSGSLGQMFVYKAEGSPTGSLYFHNGATWKQVTLT